MSQLTLSTEAMIGIIIGSILGGILLLLCIGCTVRLCCCRKKQHKSDTSKNGAPFVIRENRNSHGNPLYEETQPKAPDRRTSEIYESMEAGKAIGYAYPIVSGRPMSFPQFSPNRTSISPTSTTDTKTSNPPKRQTSQKLPPNAYRLPGLADKHISMSDSNLSTIGTINPAYDPTGDHEPSRPVHRAQSLMQVSHGFDDAVHRQKSSTADARPISRVYHYDGSLGRVTTENEKASSQGSSNKRQSKLSECKEDVDPPDPTPIHQIRVARELKPSRDTDKAENHIYAQVKRPAPSVPNNPQRLPRIPLESSSSKPPVPPADPASGMNPSSPTRRSLTSEMSYRAKGHIVTSEAFDFLEGYTDDPAKS